MSDIYKNELGTQSYDEIVDNTLNAIVSANVGISNTNYGSVVRTLIEVLAQNEDTLNYYLEQVYATMDIDNCVGEDLDRSVKILGIIREPARQAIGEITLYTGDSPAIFDIYIPYGTLVSTRPDKDGLITEFTVSESDAILKAGEYSITVQVTSVEAKEVFIPENMITVLYNTIIGIYSITNENQISGGKDIENDEEFRQRISVVRDTLGKCTDNALKFAVLEITGVSQCDIIDQYQGVGTTGISVTTDVIPAPDSVVQEIETVVADTKASGIKAFIIYTTIVYVDVDININVNEINYPDIVDAINNYCVSLDSGQTFIVKQMERQILNMVDKTIAYNDDIDIQTISPSANIDVEHDQVVRARNITINGVVTIQE